jgi:hypothetical protein
MPASPVTRQQAHEVGRIALKAGKSGATFIAGVARYTANAVRHLVRAIEAVPSAVRVLTLTGVVMLLGIVGAIALPNSFGLACVVVVVPVSSVALGALGHRWLRGQGVTGAQAPPTEVPATELQRSVEYVDKKLTFALNAFGAERHQHAMIALFQAKTAVELTLGTEQDEASHIDALCSIDDHNVRPRIRAGSAAKSLLRESNSLAAS